MRIARNEEHAEPTYNENRNCHQPENTIENPSQEISDDWHYLRTASIDETTADPQNVCAYYEGRKKWEIRGPHGGWASDLWF